MHEPLDVRWYLIILNNLFCDGGDNDGLQRRLPLNKGTLYKSIRGLLEPFECIGHCLGIKAGVNAWKECLHLLDCRPGLRGYNSKLVAFQDECGYEFAPVGSHNHFIIELIHECILLDFSHLSGNILKLANRNGFKGHLGGCVDYL